MKKIFLLLALILVVFAGRYLYLNWQRILFSFSPQAPVSPQVEPVGDTFDPSCKTAVCDNITIDIPTMPPEPTMTPTPMVVAAVTPGPKRIEVDLTNQRLYAFEGDKKVFDFLVSTGKWGRTPTGTFHIWIKLRFTRMTGGSKALHTYYDLPNVPYVMYFYNDQHAKEQGYGLHGTYWHNNFGHPMSHGCVNMKTEEAGLLYYWAMPDLKGKQSINATADNPGTEIIIYGTAPSN